MGQKKKVRLVDRVGCRHIKFRGEERIAAQEDRSAREPV